MRFTLGSILWLLLLSCNNEEENPVKNIDKPHGILVLCEGNFGWGEGELHVLDTAKSEILTNVFKEANGIKLGNVVQSATQVPAGWLIVVNNSEKVVLLAKNTFRLLATSSNLTSPRYCAFDSVHNQVYVSDLYAGGIHILDYPSLQKSGFIKLADWTEKIEILGSKLFVACLSRDIEPDTTRKDMLLVFDTERKQKVDSITLGRGLAEISLSPSETTIACTYSKVYATGKPGIVLVDARTLFVISRLPLQDNATEMHWLGNHLWFVNREGIAKLNTQGGDVEKFLFPEPGNYTSLLPLSENRVMLGNSFNYVTPARLYDCKIAGSNLRVDTSYFTTNIIGELYAY